MTQEIRNEFDNHFEYITGLRKALAILEKEHPELERMIWNKMDISTDSIDLDESPIFNKWRSLREEIAREKFEVENLLKARAKYGSITYAEWLTEVQRFNCDPYLPRISILESSTTRIGLELEYDGHFRFFGYPLRPCEKSDEDYLTKEKAQSLSKLFARLAEEL